VAWQAALFLFCRTDHLHYQGLWPYCPYASSDRRGTV